jgi:hypothetical protein
MAKFTRLGYLIGAAAIPFVIMLNAGPAFAECQSGDGEWCQERQQHRDAAVCIDRCTARANNGRPIPHIVDDDEEDSGPSALDPRVAKCAFNCQTGRRQPW